MEESASPFPISHIGLLLDVWKMPIDGRPQGARKNASGGILDFPTFTRQLLVWETKIPHAKKKKIGSRCEKLAPSGRKIGRPAVKKIRGDMSLRPVTVWRGRNGVTDAVRVWYIWRRRSSQRETFVGYVKPPAIGKYDFTRRRLRAFASHRAETGLGGKFPPGDGDCIAAEMLGRLAVGSSGI